MRREHTIAQGRAPLVSVAEAGAWQAWQRLPAGVPDASADTLQAFIDAVVVPGSVARTDGWVGYDRAKAHGFRHRITFLNGHAEPANELLPHVHLVASLLKGWWLGTHQGAVSPAHLDSSRGCPQPLVASTLSIGSHLTGARVNRAT